MSKASLCTLVYTLCCLPNIYDLNSHVSFVSTSHFTHANLIVAHVSLLSEYHSVAVWLLKCASRTLYDKSAHIGSNVEMTHGDSVLGEMARGVISMQSTWSAPRKRLGRWSAL